MNEDFTKFCNEMNKKSYEVKTKDEHRRQITIGSRACDAEDLEYFSENVVVW